MVKKIISMLLFLWVITAKAQYPISPYVVPNVDWIKYNNPSSGVVSSPMAIDINSNVYSTGYSGLTTSSNLLVFKYDSLGTMTYSYSYNNGNYDLGKAIKVDASGNAYVAGVSYSTGGLNDFYIIKLSPTGTVLWAKRLDNGHMNDEPYDIALDASGNAYVTGKTTNVHGDFDIWTIALSNSTGATLWSNIYNGAAGLNDNGSGIVLSSNSSTVYVTGNTNDAHGSNIITYALKASNGATVSGWPVITDGTAHSNDYSNGIIRCGANIVICGEINNTSTGVDYTTIKYNGLTGSIIWQKQYDFSSATNRATSLARDSADHIGVVGTALNGSTMEIHTILYDSLGNQMQVNKESTGLSSLAADPRICNDTIAHHWYVVASVSNVSQDIFVYQITPTGNTSWRKTIDGQNYDYDLGTSIGVNGVGVVYVGAHSKNSAAMYDYTTIKINQTPVYFPVDPLMEPPNNALTFNKNAGQLIEANGASVSNTAVAYYTENRTPNFFFKDNKMSFIYAHYDTIVSTRDSLHKVDVVFVKSNNLASLYDYEQLPSSKSYFMNSIPNHAVTDVKSSRRLFIPNIYPSIDLHYYSNENGIKYYFVVKPFGDPKNITHHFDGVTTTTISGTGDLLVNTLLGTLKLEKPSIYQVSYVSSTYSISPITTWTANWVNSGTDTYTFNIGSYNTSQALVFEIDQGNSTTTGVASDNMNWNTYVGGNKDDYFIDMEVDGQGNIYSLEKTQSSTYYQFPNYYVGTPTDYVNAALIHKWNKHGALIKQTYVGASGGAMPAAMTVLSDSSVVLVGQATVSLATVASFTNPSTSYTSSTGSSYILKFTNTSMNSIAWSTRYPGALTDVDANGNDDIYTVARAPKTGGDAAYLLTKTNALNLGYGSITNTQANVVSHFDKTGVPNWSSYIPCYAATPCLKVDRKRNNFYVFGQLNDTTDFKHFNQYGTFYQPTKKSLYDAFIQKFNTNDSIKVSTMYGGTATDGLSDIEILDNGDACMVGSTCSSDYSSISYNPNDGSYFHVNGSVTNATKGWITKFDSVMHRTWAITYGDSTHSTTSSSVSKDSYNNIYVGGYGSGMATVNNLPGSYYQTNGSAGNASFISFSAINQLEWCTFMGSTSLNMPGVSAVTYNTTNNKLFFNGWAATNGTGYPFRNSTSPVQAYWQPFNQNNGFADGFIGSFNFTGIVGIKEIVNKKVQNNLLIYPNPTNDKVTISVGKVNKPFTLIVYNNLGQVVYSEFVKEFDNIGHTIDVSSLKSGIYFINLNSIEMNKTAKLLKE